MKSINKISQLTNDTYNKYINKYSLKSLRSIGSENLKIKNLRYSTILNEILLYKRKNKVKILDVGCGLGDLYNFIIKKNLTKKFDYSGIEINEILLKECLGKFKKKNKFYISDILNIKLRKEYNWIILSGTFYHVPKNLSKKLYFQHIKKVLNKAWKLTKTGLIINFLNENVEYKIKKLFYPNYSDLNKFLNSLSRFRKQISNYPMYETTYVIYKNDFIEKNFKKKEFSRYF